MNDSPPSLPRPRRDRGAHRTLIRPGTAFVWLASLCACVWLAACASAPAQGPVAKAAPASEPGSDPPSSESAEEPRGEDEKTAADEKRDARRQRARILLKTVYDDRAVGEEQTDLIEAELGLYRDEALERYVQSVAVRLLRHAPTRPFDYEFKIVDQEVPNAFALPGGKIYISRGLLALASSEDELAAVLGHEITHAAERHAAARMEQIRRLNPFTIGLFRAAQIAAYGRDQERDADRGGQILSARAGYDPDAIATFLRKLDASERYVVGWSRLPSFLATHPTSPERSALASQRAAELRWERAPRVANGPEGYAEMLDGLILGEDPAGGLFKEGRFVHPDLRFSLRFPPGWTTFNSPQAVSAVSPERDAEASLSAAGEAGDLEKVVDRFLEEGVDGSQEKLKLLERRPIRIGDLPGIRITGKLAGLHAEMAFVEHAGLVFRLSFLSSGGASGKYRGRTNAFIHSFRPLDEAGTYSLEATRLRIARALENETLEQLSQRTRNALELVYTGVLNDLFASTPLTRGQRVKIGLKEPYFPKPLEEEEENEEPLPDGGKEEEEPDGELPDESSNAAGAEGDPGDPGSRRDQGRS